MVDLFQVAFEDDPGRIFRLFRPGGSFFGGQRGCQSGDDFIDRGVDSDFDLLPIGAFAGNVRTTLTPGIPLLEAAECASFKKF